MACKIGLTDRQITSFTADERTKLHAGMQRYATSHGIIINTNMVIDEDGTLWWIFNTDRENEIMRNWLNGYLMALGFNEDCVREHG